jgi:hypothetical protein
MSIHSVRARIARALRPSSGSGKPTLTRKELQGILAEAEKDGKVEVGEARLLVDLWQRGYRKPTVPKRPDAYALTPGTLDEFGRFGFRKMNTIGPVKDLGYISRLTTPGAQMAGKTYEVQPGEALQVEFVMTKNANVGSFFSPTLPALLRVSAGAVGPKVYGEPRVSRYTIRISPDAKPGTVIPIETNPLQYSVRTPGWLFGFDIRVK